MGQRDLLRTPAGCGRFRARGRPLFACRGREGGRGGRRRASASAPRCRRTRHGGGSRRGSPGSDRYARESFDRDPGARAALVAADPEGTSRSGHRVSRRRTGIAARPAGRPRPGRAAPRDAARRGPHRLARRAARAVVRTGRLPTCFSLPAAKRAQPSASDCAIQRPFQPDRRNVRGASVPRSMLPSPGAGSVRSAAG